MVSKSDFFQQGTIVPSLLVASAFVGLLAIVGLVFSPITTKPVADMRIEPREPVSAVGETFTVDVVVESSVPVNAFGGELRFSHDILAVDSIDYNTSIANLWAEVPWYSNGDGTLNFAGGTYRQGGFQGTDMLIKVTFKTLREGEGTISVKNARIILYDGLGTDAELKKSLDALVTVGDTEIEEGNLLAQTDIGAVYTIVKKPPSTDLNGDGKQSVADISIFMLHVAGNDARFDFNLDGEVGLKDLNILLSAK